MSYKIAFANWSVKTLTTGKTVLKSRVTNFEAVGGLYNMDKKFLYSSYDPMDIR